MSPSDHAKVDLGFAVRGGPIAADHGYLLFAALCRHLPWLHAGEEIGVHPIRGPLLGNRQVAIARDSRLVLRLPADRIAEALPLAGKSLDIDGASLMVGVPTVAPLTPAATLRSRLVTIRGFTDAPAFLDATVRQLTDLGVQATPQLLMRRASSSIQGATDRAAGTVLRRTLRIRDREVVGFALQVVGLTAEESLLLQEAGLGGRRRFGCGIFVPVVR
ncbi:MAG: type I-MYXAN CRISPR-associated protein Cas6/Cmx6 [Dehalococcoidia bacterium]